MVTVVPGPPPVAPPLPVRPPEPWLPDEPPLPPLVVVLVPVVFLLELPAHPLTRASATRTWLQTWDCLMMVLRSGARHTNPVRHGDVADVEPAAGSRTVRGVVMDGLKPRNPLP